MIRFTLDKILDSRGLTRYWLAKETGININAISKIYKNESKQIELNTLEKLCTALNIDIKDILEIEKVEE